jgi:hypothetical protein
MAEERGPVTDLETSKKRLEIAVSYEGLSRNFNEIARMIRSDQSITREEVGLLNEAVGLAKVGLEMARQTLSPSSTPESK